MFVFRMDLFSQGFNFVDDNTDTKNKFSKDQIFLKWIIWGMVEILFINIYNNVSGCQRNHCIEIC